MPIPLIRKVVAERYRCTRDEDTFIHIGCYSGPISNINECGAAALVKSKYSGFEEIPVAQEENEEDPI